MSLLKNLSMTSGVFFFVVVFVLSLVSAQNDFGLSPPPSDLEQLDEIQELLQRVHTLYDEKVASKVQQGVEVNEEVEEKVVEVDGQNDSPLKTSSCTCVGRQCSCCQRISVPKLEINNNYCLSLTYLPTNNSIWVTLWIDGQTVINTDVAIRNPRTICIPIRCRMPGVKICLQFQGVTVVSGWVTGCSNINVYRPVWPRGLVAVVSLGCFRIQTIQCNDQQQVNSNEIPMEALSPAGYKHGRM